MILNLLNEIAATTKTSVKQSILQNNKDNALLKRIFAITYNKQIMFHQKQFPSVDVGGSVPLSVAVEQLMDDLSTRKFTGHAARDRLRDIVAGVSKEDQEVLRRIIARDLECGAGRTLPNRVWPKLIPEQPQCLATAFSEKALKRIKYPAYSQLKADGARCMADLTDEGIRKVSRAGNEYLGLEKLESDLRVLQDFLGYDAVVDGELIYSQQIAKLPATLESLFGGEPELDEEEAKREKGNGIVNKSLKGTISDIEQQAIVFQVWDLIPYDEYYGNIPAKTPYKDRFEELSNAINDLGLRNIQIIPSKIVHNFAEAKKDYNEYRNQGKEGSILKNIDFVWKDSRVPDQVKLKNKTPIDLKIIAVYPHKKDPNKIGGFVLVDSSGLLKVNSGSGLTDTTHVKIDRKDGSEEWVYIPCTIEERGELDREYIMQNKDDYIGLIVELEVDGLQTSETRKSDEPPYSLFLPIIKKIRRDKTQANDVRDVFADEID
ncbi:DNA ligase [Pectobacterium phage POP12]|nr:DNA ligase [Pectobacterium phage POP12]